MYFVILCIIIKRTEKVNTFFGFHSKLFTDTVCSAAFLTRDAGVHSRYLDETGVVTTGKRFTKNDAGFVCAHCGAEVPPLGYSSRNHCPHCLWSLHVDVMPGDRACECKGAMRPVAVDISQRSRRGLVITHKCEKCSAVSRNSAADDDNEEELLRLTNVYNRGAK